MFVPNEDASSGNEEIRCGTCEAVHEILSRIGDKWTLAIVAVLGDRRMRFNRLHRAVDGISQRVLTACLRNLERDGFMVRRAYAAVPPHVEYELSDRGRSLRDTLEPLRAWVEIHWAAIEASRQSFDAKAEQPEPSLLTKR